MKSLFKIPANEFLTSRPGFFNKLTLNSRLRNPPIPYANSNDPNYADPGNAMRQNYGEDPANDVYRYDVNFKFGPRRADGITPDDFDYVTEYNDEWFK
jgi:hypothetical protein